MLLEELLEIQNQISIDLISTTEVRFIKEQWAIDESAALLRDLTKYELAHETTCP